MPTLLLEIGCEELPASACREAAEQLPELCRRQLAADPAALFIGPRRLAFVVEGMPDRTPDEERRGPPERTAFDEDGTPTKAGEGFARSLGIEAADLERRDGHVWGRVAGVALAEVLPDRLAGVVRGLSFGKSMRWGPPDLRFSRPVRWLCAKLDGETVSVALAGVPSGGASYGHRFGDSGVVEIERAEGYAERLRAAGVEPDADERRRLINEGLDTVGEWSDPAGVLEEVVHLVESPVVLDGSFDERFLALPERVIVTAMQSHQRYFPLGGARFAFVANGGDPELVRAGNERVLEGRLEDASFTFERDVRRGIDGLAGELGAITFVAGAGQHGRQDGAPRAARRRSWAAARRHARPRASPRPTRPPSSFGSSRSSRATSAPSTPASPAIREAVCRAIEEQYLPDAAGGPLPETEPGRVLAVAERIDNLAVAFALGERPSGTRDPYGLRRAAIGLCRLALASSFPIDVKGLVALTHRLLVEQGAEVSAEPPDDVHDFVAERLEGLLDVPVEFVRAARGSGIAQLGRLAELAVALARLPEARLDAVHTVYTRASRLAARKSARRRSASTAGCSSRTQSAKSSKPRIESRPPSRRRPVRATSTRRLPRPPSSSRRCSGSSKTCW